MKIENTSDYLKYRVIILSNKHSELSQEYENNKIHITEIRKKIDEIKSVVDEGFEMFSPKAAEEKSFNKQEVKELQMRLLLLIDDNKELNNEITVVEDELKIIHKILSDMDNSMDNDKSIANSQTNNKNVKNDNFENQEKEYIVADDLCGKLKMLADIAELDPRRVKVELNNLINKKSYD